MITPIRLFLFAVAWAGFLYVINCLIAKQLKHIDWKQALLYFTTVVMVGLFGEIFLDSVYKLIVGVPLWFYNILPILHGYTSSYAIVTWGIYGFHLYLLHGTLSSRWSIEKTRYLALIFCL